MIYMGSDTPVEGLSQLIAVKVTRIWGEEVPARQVSAIFQI